MDEAITAGLMQAQSAKYEIKVQGQRSTGWSEWLQALTVEVEQQANGPTITVLTGMVQDQAGLHGLLNQIRDLGIPLLSILLIDPPIIIHKECAE